jgi:hypothetical protein
MSRCLSNRNLLPWWPDPGAGQSGDGDCPYHPLIPSGNRNTDGGRGGRVPLPAHTGLEAFQSWPKGCVGWRAVEPACLGANHLQTNHAELGGTGRSSAARSPDRTARNGTRRNRRHEATGLITQMSLVQIQPAQQSGAQRGCRRVPAPLPVCKSCSTTQRGFRGTVDAKPLFNGLILFPILPGAETRRCILAREEPARQRAFSAPVARVYKPFANALGGPRAWYGLECPGGRSKWTTSP